MTIRKQAGTKRASRRNVVKLAAFADAPDAKALLAHWKLPAKLLGRGIYIVRSGNADWLGTQHPESKLSARVTRAGLALVQALVADNKAVQRELGAASEVGFHADLDAPELRAAFEAEGFVVEPFPFDPLAVISLGPGNPWTAAGRLLEAGEVELLPLLDALSDHEPPVRASPELMPLLAKRLERKDDLRRLYLLLRGSSDLVSCALPFVARVWKPPPATAKPRGMPPELTTLLGAFDGIPALGVPPAAEIADLRRDRMRAAEDAGPGWSWKRDWSRTKIRNDTRWREGWIPFRVRKNGETLAIDLDPPRGGQRGQIISVQWKSSQLSRAHDTLGEWLWSELLRAWR